MKTTMMKLALVAMVSAGFANAVPEIAAADSFFAARENNPGNIDRAKGLYRGLLDNGDKAAKLHAAEMLGRLAYYEGDLLTGESDSGKRESLFNQCYYDMEKVSPEAIGDKTKTYFFYRTMCLAMWAKAVGKFKAMFYLGELKSLLAEGLALDPASYQGGGMYRVAAGLHFNSSHFGDANSALDLINKAIAAGPKFYNAYLLKADALNALGKKQDALKMLADKRDEIEDSIEDGTLPSGFEAESKALLGKIKAKYNSL